MESNNKMYQKKSIMMVRTLKGNIDGSILPLATVTEYLMTLLCNCYCKMILIQGCWLGLFQFICFDSKANVIFKIYKLF